MKAAFYRRTGKARDVLEIGDFPDPEPGPGEVRVRIAFSGVNPSDVKSRAGWGLRAGFDVVIPHSDGAGTIDRVGDGVPTERIGERVWLWNAQIRRPYGTAAQYVALPSWQAVILPEDVPDAVGACLGVPWQTAWRAVYYRPPAMPGSETMLVAGGTGTVGGYAVQFARRAGFRVIASVSSVEKGEMAMMLGANAVARYTDDTFVGCVRSLTGGHGVDRIVEVDLAANAASYDGILRRGGLSVVYGSSDWSKPLPLGNLLQHGIEIALFYVYELEKDVRAAALRDSVTVLRDPSFEHRIAATFGLEEIVRAHEAVESGKMIGNVLLAIGD